MKPYQYEWHSTPQLWAAYTDDYDGAPDARGPSRCVGYGPTKEEAMADLEEQLQDFWGSKDDDAR